jgi:hypothetical protein
MHKRFAVAFQTLQDKTFTAKESRTELLLKRDVQTCSKSRAKKRVFLADQLFADFCHIDRNDFARIRGGERDAFFAAAVV